MENADNPFVPSVNENRSDKVGGFIESKRGEFFAKMEIRETDDIQITDVENTGLEIEPARSLSDSEFSAFETAMSDLPGFSRVGSREFAVAQPDELGAPDPREVNQNRSKRAIEQDRNRQAEVTTDPYKYASDPDSYDYPFVDTPESWNEEHIEESPLTGQHFTFPETE